MQQRSFCTKRKMLVAVCIAVMILAQRAHAGPLVSWDQSSSDQSTSSLGEHTVHALRRMARMTPLWRIMSSKPSGAFCQNNFECTTGLCRDGHCSATRPSSEPVKY